MMENWWEKSKRSMAKSDEGILKAKIWSKSYTVQLSLGRVGSVTDMCGTWTLNV